MSLLNPIKLFLIPHEHNGFRPRILEIEYFSITVVIIILLKILSVASFSQYLGATIFDQVSQGDLYTLTNDMRGQNNLPVLAVSQQLQTAAELKLADMSANQYFAHVSPSGTTPWTWFDKAGYQYLVAGENLAMDFNSSQDVMQAWLNSPAHRKNILLPDFTQVGIAVGKITIDARPRIAVVQEFGKPEVVVAKRVVPPARPSVTATSVPQTVATTFRTEPSQPIKPAPIAKTQSPQVQGAETMNAAPYFAVNSFSIILLILALASIAVAGLNIAVARRTQFPVLIMRSVILVGICILAFVIKDYQFMGNHIILP